MRGKGDTRGEPQFRFLPLLPPLSNKEKMALILTLCEDYKLIFSSSSVSTCCWCAGKGVRTRRVPACVTISFSTVLFLTRFMEETLGFQRNFGRAGKFESYLISATASFLSWYRLNLQGQFKGKLHRILQVWKVTSFDRPSFKEVPLDFTFKYFSVAIL